MASKPFFERIAKRISVERPGQLSPLTLRVLLGPLATLLKILYRPTMSGWENLPSHGPMLIVANHSGSGGLEILVLAMLWHEHFQGKRPVTGMAHPVAWYLPGPAQTVQSLGAVPSSYTAGLQVLHQGLPVLIFPGGDFDAFRPIWQANHVDFNGRKGFLKLARRADVPIVPLGIQGSHYTVPILWRSRLLPWLTIVPGLLGVKRAPVTLLGAIGAALILAFAGPVIGYGWAALLSVVWISSPIAIWLPLIPSTIRVHIGAPLPPEELFAEIDNGNNESDAFEDSYTRVVEEIQHLVLKPPHT